MSLGKTWYQVDAAAEKFGIDAEQIQEWVSEGLLRTEISTNGKTLVNGDDLLLQVEGIVTEVHDAGSSPEINA